MKTRLFLVFTVLLVCFAARWALVFHAEAQADRTPSGNGDTNGDGSRDISDALFLLNFLFLGGPEPVAIAGSPELEARVRALEEQVAQIAAGGPQKSPLAMALESLARLGGSQAGDVWSQPEWKFHDTSAGGATPGTATFFVNGSQLQGRVIAFTVVEDISEPTRFDVLQEVPAAAYRPPPLGATAKLAYSDATGQAFFHGEVSLVALAGTTDTSVYLNVRCFSKLHRLTRGSKSKVFGGVTAPEIAKTILSASDILAADMELVLEGSISTKYDHVYQHNQTDLEFLSRLMEEEGIFYFEVQTDAGAKIRFADGPSALLPAAGPALTHLGHLAPAPSRPGAYAFDLHRAVSKPLASVTVGDYDPVSATTLFATATSADGAGDDDRFGVNLFDRATLDALAHRELEVSQASADSIEGETNSVSLRPGSIFTIQGVDAFFNGKYLVTGVTHRYVGHNGSNGFTSYFGNTVRGQSDRVRYRPPHKTPKPPCPGVHPAFVTGPAGVKTYTDALGRVKVKFPWIRDGSTDENASAWVRVAQNGFGTGGQGFFLPEVGDEVLVAFEHGDIDRPVVVGSLWNGTDKPPR